MKDINYIVKYSNDINEFYGLLPYTKLTNSKIGALVNIANQIMLKELFKIIEKKENKEILNFYIIMARDTNRCFIKRFIRSMDIVEKFCLYSDVETVLDYIIDYVDNDEKKFVYIIIYYMFATEQNKKRLFECVLEKYQKLLNETSIVKSMGKNIYLTANENSSKETLKFVNSFHGQFSGKYF